MSVTKKICICISDKESYSETFIKAHIEQLNAEVIVKSMLPIQIQLNSESSNSLYSKISNALSSIIRVIKNKELEKSISRKIKEKSIGVVLAEYGQIGVAVLETCKKNNLPLVVHFHGFDTYKKDHLQKLKIQYEKVFEYAKALIVVSKDMEKQLLKLGAAPSKVFCNVYGVDVTKFKKNEDVASSHDVLFVGRFVEKKAPQLSILAFQKVLKTIPNAKLYMVGDGALLNECKNLIEKLKIQESVILLGVKSHLEVAEMMQKSRIYIQHSIVPKSGDSEGTPNSILEAQASGIPVVSTKHGGIPDVVIHGKTGFLVEENDVDGMARHIEELLLDEKLAIEMGNNARQNIIQNFDLNDSVAKLKSILFKSMNS